MTLKLARRAVTWCECGPQASAPDSRQHGTTHTNLGILTAFVISE